MMEGLLILSNSFDWCQTSLKHPRIGCSNGASQKDNISKICATTCLASVLNDWGILSWSIPERCTELALQYFCLLSHKLPDYAQKAELFLGGLKQDTKGQASAKEISRALEHENILNHKDQASLHTPYRDEQITPQIWIGSKLYEFVQDLAMLCANSLTLSAHIC